MMFIATMIKKYNEHNQSIITILVGACIGFAIVALMALVGMWLYNIIFPTFGAPVINFKIALAIVFVLNEITLFMQHTKEKRA